MQQQQEAVSIEAPAVDITGQQLEPAGLEQYPERAYAALEPAEVESEGLEQYPERAFSQLAISQSYDDHGSTTHADEPPAARAEGYAKSHFGNT